ncbi:hypothetical protein GGX14DRAFT_658778 [Mycena pura]|uniref:Uncharacterized protein n=1 Tax=Mycena pura TaxID=153505 RepID=A0AAD6V9S1_9AGAR|nr:hypothetical protein GGX14DRAFT_658778 [Mycena pura]
MTQTPSAKEQLAAHFDRSAVTVRAYADKFEHAYARPALATTSSFFDQYPLSSTFISIFCALAFFPVVTFLTLSVFAVLSVLFLALSGAFIASSAVVLLFLSILVLSLITTFFASGCISVFVVSAYLAYRFVALVRSSGSKGVSTWAVETKGRFIPSNRREASDESAALVVDVKEPLSDDSFGDSEFKQEVVPPGGQFHVPEQSSTPLLVFRCTPIITPYIEEDDEAGILVDTFLTYSRYTGAEPIIIPQGPTGTASETLGVSISINGTVLANAVVPFNSTSELHFPLANLSRARKQQFPIDCTASYISHLLPEPQIFSVTTGLSYLPRPPSGSVTKRDARTGALLVKPRSGDLFEAIFPMGFYTSFDNYLDSDLVILDDIKAQGFTIVHPVPTFGDLEALSRVLDRMEELGLYLVYDMRQSLASEVNMIKHRPNLLLWYTADEPDGTSEPLDATRHAYDTVYELDGYHPVSIALNCADYEFTAYASGADVVMPDTYTIANDPRFSAKYNTSCTVDFGCCGCDNCQGELEDVSRRLDNFAMRLDVLGWARERVLWAVPQAFGGDEFWTRPPTGREFAVQVILSVNHGARGIMPWIDPTPPDIKDTASALATALTSPTVTRFIFSPLTKFSRTVSNRIDVAMWAIGSETLILVANLNTHDADLAVPLSSGLELREVLNYGVRRESVGSQLGLELEGLGCAVFIAYSSPLMLKAQGEL